ncbi:beta-galactosidase [Mucilaginibacter gracilis]|uniref:Beta-galactosidase n=1 Tax=Mucilaginibacter gracilis TaxID=423350 RepID=A0A495J3Z7_9SPHI|nr:glycoside hydrolase family 2 TIM barrel-domain containing protein [Mucilaginibacter gracilis]RKR83700.1 beta-galactosidase [Mucilaginibacter gracilis]
MKKIKLGLILILLSVYGYGQQTSRINNNWQFLKQDIGGIWEAVRPVTAGNPESVPVWSQVSLPHCFNSRDAVDPTGNYYQGPGWYRTQIDVQNPYTYGRTLLHFEGAGQKTDVYLYTTKVGSHLGGYDEWTVDITKAAEDFKKTAVCKKQFGGKVPISIRCDNSRDLESIPSRLSDFCVYGGIYRYLNLVYAPSLSIDKVFASASVDLQKKAGLVNVRLRFYNPGKDSLATVKSSLFDPAGRVVDSSQIKLKGLKGDIAVSSFSVQNPSLWSPNNPALYTLKVSVIGKTGAVMQTEKVGFRNFEFVDYGPFKLNGQRLLLKGTHRHDDQAGVAAAVTEDMMRKEMLMIKDMGANFIRLGHYQQSRIILNLCDSLGILVWEEEPWCRGGLGGDVYKNQARGMLTNMIEQHYNHPAVIIWGLGNENDWEGDFSDFDKQEIRTFMGEQNDRAHRLDPSRKTAIRRCDFCKDIVDVYSPSIWAGWYRGAYKDYKYTTETEFKLVKHFLHIEWGGDSQALRNSEDPEGFLNNIPTGKGADERLGDANLHGGNARVSRDGDWSESYICDLFDWTLKEQETMPWLTGTAFWTFKDFATPLRPENPVPYVNQKGVVEHDLTKKESYYVFQSYWANKPMVHIYGHNWPVRWGKAGELKMVKVYSNCTEAELFANGKSYGVKKRNSADFPAAGFHWDVVFKPGSNHLKVVAKSGGTVLTDEIDQMYQTEKWSKPSKIIIKKVSLAEGVVTVQVNLVDDQGIQCLDAKNTITFSLAGDGTLLDNVGTSRGSRVVQAYNGRALISVKTNNGSSTIGVSSAGLPTVFLAL